jgi:DNA-binding NtrC family response regulator
LKKGRILVVEDEPGIRQGLRAFLEAKGYEVQEADAGKDALASFAARPADAVVLDNMLPDGSGIDLVARLKEAAPTVPVVMLTAHGSIELAVRAIKEGADQFLTKPVDLSAVLVILERLLDNRRVERRQAAGLTRQAREAVDPFVGQSPAMKRLSHEAASVADSDSTVLILGDTGAGKGVLARWLHERGPRAAEPFVDLNCAGLSTELLESDLFGHEAGAFTGATRAKQGLLEAANKGTVFLDEIGDMELPVQPKLLKAIEEGLIRRLGEVKDRYVDIRLIAATHHDLAARVREKKFRSDLFFRINTVTLEVPPLRDRTEDIPILTEQLVARLAGETRHGRVMVSDAAMRTLENYSWPGNVRELRNVLERALLLSRGDRLEPEHLRFAFPDAPREKPAAAGIVPLEEVEREHIAHVLREMGGRVDAAARALGISRSTLYQKVKRFELDRGKGPVVQEADDESKNDPK